MNPFNAYALDIRARLDRAAAWDEFADPTLREFVLRPLLLAGALTEPQAAAPSLLHVLRLLKIVALTDYLVLPRGVASFHEALAARLSVRLGTRVARLVVENAAVIGIELDGTAAVLRADHVVVATTPREAAGLLPAEWKDEREFLDGIEIPPVVLPTFFLDRPLEPGVWSYMTQAGRGGLVSFVVDAAQKNPTLAGSGNSILQAWPCYPATKALVPQNDSDVVESCRRELETCFPGFSSWIEEVHVARHPYAVPFNPAGHQQRAADFLRCVDQRKGLSLCGDYLTGGFMEAALWSATRAASRHA
jgi:protoporphyrinogen oxidase